MSGGEPALRLVNAESGESIPFLDAEVAGLQAEIDKLQSQLKKADGDINRWRWKCEQLERDREEEARKDALWPKAVRLHNLYCRVTPKKNGEPRNLTWNADRFEMVAPFLRKHGIGMCERAIIGRVFDHFTAKRKNGTTIHYHEWERIFKSAAEFEESCNRAPADFVSELEAEDQLAAAEAEAG